MDIEEKRRRNREYKRKKYWEDAEKERERKRLAQRNYDDVNRRERARQWRDKNIERIRRYDGLPEPTRPEPEFCECCGSPPSGNHKRLCLDHDHATGKFRAWLCQQCNKALGLVKDNPVTLRNLAVLLEQNTQV